MAAARPLLAKGVGMEQREPAVVIRCAPKRALSTMALAVYLGISRQSIRRAVSGFI
jgi:biotin operon repressor